MPAQKSSAGFDNPNIRITDSHFEPNQVVFMGEDGSIYSQDDPEGGGVWVIGAVIYAADGTRTTIERFADMLAAADEADLEAAIAERWGI